MKHYLPLMVIAVMLLLFFDLSAQTPTIQDCLGAIPICEPIYHEDKVANGEGNYPNEIDNAISCLADERNAIWYTFTVNETGDFGFILTPNDPDDDYDWALYDLTNATCEEIRTNPDLLVSCNAAGQQGSDVTCIGPTGPTGGSNHDIQGAGCHNDPPTIRNGLTPLNALVPVQKYNRYVLVVSNWSRSTAGYTIDFSVSAGIGIFDLEDPEVVEANFPEQCGDNAISIEFNENIQCATVNNFNFVLDGPGGPYEVSVLSPVCDQGGLYTPKFDLVVDPPITESGEFTLSLDGDRSTEVLDLCNNPAFNTTLSFEVEIEGAIEVDLGEDIAICPGNGVTLDATLDAQSSHFDATYLWSTGATTPTINVSQPGDYSVTVTLGCASGSDVVSLTVDGADSGPYVNLGGDRTLCVGERIELDATNFDADYSWSTGSSSPIITVREAGTYSVTVTDDCGTTTQSVEITYADVPEVDLGADLELCPGESTTLELDIPDATYLWHDGSTESSITVKSSGIYAVSVTTLCGTITDELEVTFPRPINLDLGEDQQICDEQAISLDASVTMNNGVSVVNTNTTYTWQDGSTNPTFQVIESGIYEVTITNGCETLTDQIEITFGQGVSVDLGADQTLCQGETLELNVAAGNATYLWQDGSTNPTFQVSEAGIYEVTVTSDCGEAMDQIEVSYTAPLSLELGADQQLCHEQNIILNAENTNATYAWQDGSTNSTFEVTQSGIYEVTVTNNCETLTDKVEIIFGNGVSVDLGTNQTLCQGEILELNVGGGDATYLWQNGSTDATFTVTEAGIYAVTLTSECGEASDQIEVTYVDALSLELGANQQLCDGQSVTLDATNTDATYTWQDGSANPTFEVTESGVYEVTITNGCETLTDQIEITFGQGVSVDLGADQTLCQGETLELNVAAGNATYLWSDGSTNPNLTVSEAGIYEVTVTSDCGEASDQIEVTYVEALSLELGANQQLCDGQSVTLDATNTDATYTWQDGSTNPTFEVTESGTYEVTITNDCETLTDQIEITFGQGVSVDLGADQTLCQGETLELNVAAGNATYLWSDGSTNPTFQVSEAGIYEVTVTSDCGEASDQIEVSYVEALSLELGANRQLCDGQSVTLDATNTDATYTWQDGSANPTFEVTQSGTYEVTITNGCETLTDQIEITFGQGVSVDLGADRELCAGEELELHVDIDNATLRWQDGSSNDTFIITESGIYWLEAVADCGTVRDSIVVNFVEVPSINLGDDQQLCEGDVLELQISEEYAVRWQDGSTQNTFTITQAGTYSVELANQCGRAGDAITVNYTPDFELDLGEDQRICEGENLLLESGLEEVDFRWQDGSTDATLSTDQSGEYWLEASNECFVHFDTIEVIVQTPPTVELGEGGLLCEGDVVVLDASSDDEVNYTWSDGSTESTLEVTSDGIYQVTVSNECGRMDDFIRFTTPAPIEVDLGQDTTLCEGSTYTLLANTDLELEYRWQDGSGDHRFIVEEPGEYLVQVSNECETVIDVVNVVPCQVCDLYAPNVFSPNFDGRNERFSVFPNCQFLEYQLQVYDRWGTLIFQSEDREEGWTGLIGNRPAPQGVYVWKIKYMVEENYEMSKRVEVGEVTLLR